MSRVSPPVVICRGRGGVSHTLSPGHANGALQSSVIQAPEERMMLTGHDSVSLLLTSLAKRGLSQNNEQECRHLNLTCAQSNHAKTDWGHLDLGDEFGGCFWGDGGSLQHLEKSLSVSVCSLLDAAALANAA